MKNKGFTLIELLAVIVILAIIALIATPIILNIIDNTKESSKERSKELYLDAVYNSVAAYNMKDPLVDLSNTTCDIVEENNEELDITVGDLACGENKDIYIKVEMDGEKPKSGSITFVNGKIENETVSFEDAKSQFETICDYDEASTVEEKKAGAKYHCDVDGDGNKNHTFYVLTTPKEGDTTINLIMDQNINSDGTLPGHEKVQLSTRPTQYNIVAWNKESGQSKNVYGPVTAMQFLYNATKDWTNIDPLNYTYNDRETQNSADGNGYVSFVSENGVATITPLSESASPVVIGTKDVPLRARMPIYSSDPTKTEVSDKTDANAYLYGYLDSSGQAVPYGYWTLSSQASSSNFAWYVGGFGDVYYGYIMYDDFVDEEGNGVRPVITVELD